MPTEKVRARDLLLLFAQVSKIFIRPKYKLQILNCIKQSKTNHIVKYNFEHYIKSILLTQFYWRKYQEIKKTRLAELFKSWNLVLGKLIKEDLKNTKRKKKSNIDSGKYFYINKGAQTFVLNEYMNEKTKQVYSIMRLKCGRIFVGFKPSSKEMRWLIERAANIGISIEKT